MKDNYFNRNLIQGVSKGLFGFIVIIVISIIWLHGIAIADWIGSTSYYLKGYKDLAHLGDAYAVVNTLLTAISSVLIILSLYFQRKSLSIQQDELESTRKEFILNRTTDIAFKLLDFIDKSMTKLQYYIIFIQPMPDDFESQWVYANYPPRPELKQIQGISGITKFNQHFNTDVNNIIYGINVNKVGFNRVEIDCLLNNTQNLISLSDSIFDSIQILIKMTPVDIASERDNSQFILLANLIGDEIYLFLRNNYIISKKLAKLEPESITPFSENDKTQFSDIYLKVSKLINAYCSINQEAKFKLDFIVD